MRTSPDVAVFVRWPFAGRSPNTMERALRQPWDRSPRRCEPRRSTAADLPPNSPAPARLLALLPLVGIAMGQALDAEPLRMLLTTPWGRLALVAGISLEVCGT